MRSLNLSPGRLFRLLEFSDSALPVGGFSFSCGLESAVASGRVDGESSLAEYLLAVARQVATCDGVATLAAHRATRHDRWSEFVAADRAVGLFKCGDESRRMSLRMGHKLGALAQQFLPDGAVEVWLQAIERGEIEGHHAPMLARLFALAGLDEQMLFTTLIYGVASQITGAALRLMRIDHFATQRLLYALSGVIDTLYAEVEPLSLEQMHLFAPELEIIAALHEQGSQRLFMS